MINHVIDSSARAKLRFLFYNNRFLAVYVVIGVLSLWLEVLLMRGLHYLGFHLILAQLIGLGAGIFFAFWMNVRFNFKVPVAKRNRALGYFALISTVSASINFVFKAQLVRHGWSYEQARFAVSGVLFLFAYWLHRRYSFSDRKQVGVAVYANGVEDIKEIKRRIGEYPDFIHVDLIDQSFGQSDQDVRSYRLETIQAYWPRLKIHVHMMTAHPLSYLADVTPYADMVIVHAEGAEDLGATFAQIHAAGCQAGLCLRNETPVEQARPWLDKIALLVLLAIPEPGKSGQTMAQSNTLNRIKEINHWPERPRFALCVDGGVSEQNIHLLNVEFVVSGSSVLNSTNSARQIMRLQTSNNHEAV